MQDFARRLLPYLPGILDNAIWSLHTRLLKGIKHMVYGFITAKPQGRAPGTTGKLAAHIAFLVERVTSEPDITLQELADALRETRGVEVQLSSIHRALIRAGYSYKKRAGGAGA